VRYHASGRLLFILNHTATTQEVMLDRPYYNLLDEPMRLEGALTVAPRDVLILEEAD
jgi:hypothetical protein